MHELVDFQTFKLLDTQDPKFLLFTTVSIFAFYFTTFLLISSLFFQLVLKMYCFFGSVRNLGSTIVVFSTLLYQDKKGSY